LAKLGQFELAFIEGFMKQILAASVFMGLLSASAFAADLPTHKAPEPPPAPAPFSWTGAYGGINLGAIIGDSKADPACIDRSGVSLGTGCAIAPSFGLGSVGVLGGGQIGYNYQYNTFVFGLETDLQGSSLAKSGSASGTFPQVGGTFTTNGTISATDKIDYFGTVRGRIGLAYGRTLFYATGGLIYADVNTSFQRTFPAISFSGSNDETRAGYVVGGGLEYAFTDHWTVKAEGLYYDLGHETLLASAQPSSNGFLTGYKYRDSGEIARLGLNYKF
jgi:outer membrane immunogenic protein